MRLSVITPVYNRSDCILRCLESVTRQNGCGTDIEHIVVDDGSTDGTADIIKKYAASHNHVKPMFFDKNRGTNAARNVAISTAVGNYCVLLDSDDYFVDNAAETIFNTIDGSLCYRCYMFAIGYRSDEFDRVIGPGGIIEYDYSDALTGRVHGDYVHVISRDLLREYPFDEGLRIYEGLIMKQIYRHAGNMLFINTVLTVVDRGRNDGASLLTVRVSCDAIKRQMLASVREIELFGEDYMKYGADSKLDNHYFLVADNALLLGDYTTASRYIPYVKNRIRRNMLRVIMSLRLSNVYRKALYVFLKMKYHKAEV